MRMTRCIIGLASALMLAASVNVFAENGERVATVENYPTHSEAMLVVVPVAPYALQERLCSQTVTLMDNASSNDGMAVSTLNASEGVTLPNPARITSKPVAA